MVGETKAAIKHNVKELRKETLLELMNKIELCTFWQNVMN